MRVEVWRQHVKYELQELITSLQVSLRATKETLREAQAEIERLTKQLAIQAKLAKLTKKPTSAAEPPPFPPSTALLTTGDSPAPHQEEHHDEAHVCKTLQKTKAVDFVKANLAKKWGRKAGVDKR